jgi:hypothetical protein
MITPASAASELLARRRARASFLDYNRYIAEADGEGEFPVEHHILLCNALQDVADGTIENLMVFMPPGSAKSTYATVRFPAWYLGVYRRRGVVSASYNSTLADHFGKKVRNLVQSPAHQRVFPACKLKEDSRAKGEWETDSGGFYFSCGVGEGVNGRRGDLAIGDDIIKGRKDAESQTDRDSTWEWWKSDIRTRLKPKTARRIIIRTRWHEDDPAGRILPDNYAGESGWVDGRDGGKWYVICLPAEARANDPLGRKPGEWLWPDWFSPAYWNAEKDAQGPRNWLSLYQQTPTVESGTYFKREWMQRYTDLPEHMTVYMSGDFAVTDGGGDFTEIGVWGVDTAGRVFMLDWWHGQTSADVWVKAMVSLAEQWKPIWFIGETGPIRRAVEPILREEMESQRHYFATEWLSGGDKAANARPFQALCSMRKVHFPATDKGERVIDQLLRFPAGKHDDAVDACGLFGRFIDKTWKAVAPKKQEVPNWDAPVLIRDLVPDRAAA